MPQSDSPLQLAQKLEDAGLELADAIEWVNNVIRAGVEIPCNTSSERG